MTTESTHLLTHFDPPNKYAIYDAQLDDQIYKRFTRIDPCLRHVQKFSTISESELHFYLPDSESNQIPEPVNGSNDTRIYLYCLNEQALKTNQGLFRGKALFKILLEDRLEFHLRQSETELMYELTLQSPQGSAQRNQWANLGKRQLNQMKNLFQKHIDTQLGEEVRE